LYSKRSEVSRKAIDIFHATRIHYFPEEINLKNAQLQNQLDEIMHGIFCQVSFSPPVRIVVLAKENLSSSYELHLFDLETTMFRKRNATKEYPWRSDTAQHPTPPNTY